MTNLKSKKVLGVSLAVGVVVLCLILGSFAYTLSRIERERNDRIEQRCEKDHELAEFIRGAFTFPVNPSRPVDPNAQEYVKAQLERVNAIDCIPKGKENK